MTSPREPLILYTDPEHRGLQLAIPLILFVAFWLSYVLLSSVLRAVFPGISSAVLLSCIGAIPLSLLVAGASEALLKRIWHAGGKVQIEADKIRLLHPERDEVVLNRQEPLNDLWWKMPLKGYSRGGRERRVPEKDFCMAGQFQQEGQRLIVFCYASPRRAKAWQQQYEFTELNPADVYDTSYRSRIMPPTRPELPPEVIAGRYGRYWLAERNRWTKGVEVTPESFEELLQETYTPGKASHED